MGNKTQSLIFSSSSMSFIVFCENFQETAKCRGCADSRHQRSPTFCVVLGVTPKEEKVMHPLATTHDCTQGEGAPFRYPLEWGSAEFYDEKELERETRRVFDVCHGCRRCYSLCNRYICRQFVACCTTFTSASHGSSPLWTAHPAGSLTPYQVLSLRFCRPFHASFGQHYYAN